jgi:4'-phosphopantetheinyl transferase
MTAGDVELRLLALATAADELARLRSFLNDGELQRGNRLLEKRLRDRFFAGRGMLRELLGGYLGEKPGDVRLSEGEFGKPHLADQEADALRFNLSHAGDYLLVAVAAGCEVGCDLEEVREDLPFQSMAQRYFSPQERDQLFSLPAEQQLAAFYRCWTRKEAYLKGTGTGFSHPSTEFDVSLLPHQAPALLCHRGNPGEPAKWEMRDIQAPPGYCAALALELKSPRPPGEG